MYNGLVRLNVQANEAWSDITVQLKGAMILSQISLTTVKGYATNTKKRLRRGHRARTQALNAHGVKENGSAETNSAKTLKSLFAVAENYPQTAG